MLISAIAALALFAAPETTQAGEPAAAEKPSKSAKAEKGPAKTCYTTTPSGSRMPRKVCVTKAVESTKDDAKPGSSKPE